MNMRPVLAGLFAFALSLTPAALWAQSSTGSSQGGSNTPASTTDQGARSGAGQSGAEKSGAAGKMEGTSSSQSMQMAPKTFVKKAAHGGMAEVKLGQLGEKRASNQEVKNFAQMMVTDHTRANDELKTLAKSKHLVVPTALDPKDKQAHTKLSKLSGDRFDQAYMKQMVEDHEKAVNLFQQASTGLSDPELRNFATTTLPTLQKHLEMARNIQQQLSGGGNKSTSMNHSGTMPTEKTGSSAAQH